MSGALSPRRMDSAAFPSLEEKLLLLKRQREIQQQRSQHFFEHITSTMSSSVGDKRAEHKNETLELHTSLSSDEENGLCQRVPEFKNASQGPSPRKCAASASHPPPGSNLPSARRKLPRPRHCSSFVDRHDHDHDHIQKNENDGNGSFFHLQQQDLDWQMLRMSKPRTRKSAPAHSRSSVLLLEETDIVRSPVEASSRATRHRRSALSGPCDINRMRRRTSGVPQGDFRRRAGVSSWSGSGLTIPEKIVGSFREGTTGIPASPPGGSGRRVPGSGCRLPHDDVYRDAVDFSDEDSPSEATLGRGVPRESSRGVGSFGSWEQPSGAKVHRVDEQGEEEQPMGVQRRLSCDGVLSDRPRTLTVARNLFSSCEERFWQGRPQEQTGSCQAPDIADIIRTTLKVVESAPAVPQEHAVFSDWSVAEGSTSSASAGVGERTLKALYPPARESITRQPIESQGMVSGGTGSGGQQPVHVLNAALSLLSRRGQLAAPMFSDYSASEACTSSASECESSIRSGTARLQRLSELAETQVSERGEDVSLTSGIQVLGSRQECDVNGQVLNAAQMIMARKLRPVPKPCAAVFSDYASTDYNTSSASESETSLRYEAATSRYMQSGLAKLPKEVSSSGSG